MSEHSRGYEGWRVLAGAAIGVFVSFASVVVYTFGVFLKPLTETFGWSRESVSVAFGIAAMTVAVCSPPLGMLLDRFGPRRVIVPCLVVFGLSYASLAWLTPQLLHLYVTFFVIGIVANGTAQMAYARAVSTWFRARRGFALAVLMAGGAVGAIVLPGLAQQLIATAGWRYAFLFLGCGVLLLGVPVAVLLIRERPGSRSTGTAADSGSPVTVGLRSRAFWLVVGSLFLVSLGQNSAITHMPALLTDGGVAAGSAAMAVSVLGVASLLGRMATGWLLDRFYAPRVSMALLLIAACGVLLLASANSAWQGFAAAALIGLGLGGEADVTPYLIARYFGLRSFATLYGFTWTAYAIAGGVGPVLMGRAFDGSHSYAPLLVVLGVLTVAAAGLMGFMPVYPPVGVPESESEPTRGAFAANAE